LFELSTEELFYL